MEDEGMDGAAKLAAPTALERVRKHQQTQRSAIKSRAFAGTEAAAIESEREGQRDTLDLIGLGATTTAAYGLYRFAEEEVFQDGQVRDPTFSPSAHYDELTTGVPFMFHDEILESTSLAQAQRARERVLKDMQVQSTLNVNGVAGTAAMLAGSILDIDLPLTLMTDGAYTSAKVSRRLRAVAQMRGMPVGAVARASSIISGGISGGIAGAAVGSADAAVRETSDWSDVPYIALTGMAVGAGIGAVTPTRRVKQQLLNDVADEYRNRVATDLELGKLPDFSNAQAYNLFSSRAPEVDKDGSMGAARNADRPDLKDVNVGDRTADLIDNARDWREDTGWLGEKKAEAGAWYVKAMQGLDKVGLAGDFQRLYDSNSAVANWFAGTILESPSGIGRGAVSAATRREAYNARIMTQVAEPYTQHLKMWAKDHGGTQFNGLHVTNDGTGAFGREVHLELNARRHTGKDTPGIHPSVTAAANAVEKAADEAFAVSKGRAGEVPMTGFDTIVPKRGYTPLVWQGQAMRRMINDGMASKAEIQDAITDGYVSTGIDRATSKAISRAVITRALKKDDGFDMSLESLLSSDGREYLRDVLINNGQTAKEADSIIERLSGSLTERGTDSAAKRRTEIDLGVQFKSNGNLRVVDLVQNDMIANWSRHSQRTAGSAALARAGIQDRAMRTEVRDAIVTEQRGIGEQPMDPEFIDKLFTHFDGGPIAGGIDPMVMRAKRMTNLALLNKLGITQAGETGAVIAAVGWENFIQHSRGFSKGLDGLYKDVAKGNPDGILDELKPLMGDIGLDHQFFRDDLALDETRMGKNDQSEFWSWADKALSKGSRLQGFVSGFYQVRKAQQRIAVSTMADKALQTVRDGGSIQRLLDIGLDRDTIAYMRDKATDGTVDWKDGFVNRMNIDNWDAHFAEVFSSALHRHQNQVVQKAMAGEDGVWMHESTASLLLHLKSFPLLAISKQAIRHGKAQDPAAMATLLMGLGTAGLSYIVKQLVEGRTDRLSPEEVMQGAFGMSNITGFVPMMVDPVATMFGLDDYRFNQYGPHTEMQVPALEVGNRLLRAPGAILDTVTGNADSADRQAVRSLPFASAYGVSLITDMIGR